jgi:hypothetical protein
MRTVLVVAVAVTLCFGCSGSGQSGGRGGGTAGGSGGGAGTGGSSSNGGGTATGGGSAATGGGMSTGDGGFYGAVKCPNSNYLVCDDFEGATLDPQWDPSGNVSIDTTMAARGSHALHSVGGDALISLHTTVPFDGQRLWGRMFVYVPGRLSAQLANHINISTASGNNDLNTNCTYGVMFGGDSMGALFYQENPGVDTSALDLSTPVPLDRWFCVEWDFNGVAKQTGVYLDGQLLNMTELDGYHPPINATLSVGVQFTLDEAWFDSVAFSRTRIGCSN